MSTKSMPKIRRVPVTHDFTKEREWLKAHRHEYVGKWVVLDGDRLVGAGEDPRPIVEQARAEGVTLPFVEFIRDLSERVRARWE